MKLAGRITIFDGWNNFDINLAYDIKKQPMFPKVNGTRSVRAELIFNYHITNDKLVHYLIGRQLHSSKNNCHNVSVKLKCNIVSKKIMHHFP